MVVRQLYVIFKAGSFNLTLDASRLLPFLKIGSLLKVNSIVYGLVAIGVVTYLFRDFTGQLERGSRTRVSGDG